MCECYYLCYSSSCRFTRIINLHPLLKITPIKSSSEQQDTNSNTLLLVTCTLHKKCNFGRITTNKWIPPLCSRHMMDPVVFVKHLPKQHFLSRTSSSSICYLLSGELLCLLKAHLTLNEQKLKTVLFSSCFVKIYCIIRICNHFYFILGETGVWQVCDRCLSCHVTVGNAHMSGSATKWFFLMKTILEVLNIELFEG